MSIEIRQLNIKSSVMQQAGGKDDAVSQGGAAKSAGGRPLIGSACAGTQLDEDTRSDILAECRAMVLDLLNRSRER